MTSSNTSYAIIVKGDVTGDGKISISDVTRTKKHILQLELLQGEYLKASDVNESKDTTIGDVTLIRKALLKLENF